jgi:2-dehydropantoate 2-reductase
VTLLFHRAAYYYEWKNSEQEIKITTNGITVARAGFDVEPARCGWRKHGKSLTISQFFSEEEPYNLRDDSFEQAPFPDEDLPEPIQNLIVTVKAPNTVGALLAIRPRLGPNSSIFFLQNGMGMIDQVNKEVFPDPATRPSYMLGIISHGVSASPNGRFAATHAGMGTVAIGILPRNVEGLEKWSASSRYILRTICRVPVLAAVPNAPSEIIQAQLEKLAINAVINPITALVDSRNGAMLYNYPLKRVIRLLLAEISLVILSMPELKALPNLATRFSTERLETLVTAVAYKTGDNISSMLGDVREGRRTEIDFINGYIVKRGEEMGITCFMNYMIVQLIKGKQLIVDRERTEELPLAKLK